MHDLLRSAKRLTLAAALLLAPLAVRGQEVSVSGQVTRGQVPQARLLVRVAGQEGYTYTDVNGRYRLHAVPAGVQTIEVVQGNRVIASARVEVGPGRAELQRDLQLP